MRHTAKGKGWFGPALQDFALALLPPVSLVGLGIGVLALFPVH